MYLHPSLLATLIASEFKRPKSTRFGWGEFSECTTERDGNH